MSGRFCVWMLLLLGCMSTARADVRLPAIFGDGVVVQQQSKVAVWGWARPGETVKLTASWEPKRETPNQTQADARGAWRLYVNTPDAATATGPQSITVAGDTTITIRDVLIGEVWVCSGQSNMEWPLAASMNAETEIAAADDPMLRLFTVRHAVSLHPMLDCEGAWAACQPSTARTFSAAGYFFARELRTKLKVPVGVISACWGGTPVESWLPEDTAAGFPEFADALGRYRALRDPQTRDQAAGSKDAWWNALDGRARPAMPRQWNTQPFDDSAWETVQEPAPFSGSLSNFDGVVYLRRVVTLPPEAAGKAAALSLGPIDDRDDAWVNGKHVGGTRTDGQWNRPREYEVPAGVLVAGANVVAVRVVDTGGPGGLGGPAEQMQLKIAGGAAVSLAGTWRMKAGAAIKQLPPIDEAPPSVGPGSVTVLYNGMVHPIRGFAARGFLWYQGESNVGRAAQYRTWFPAMIDAWRKGWGSEEMAFLFVQIAPFNYKAGTSFKNRLLIDGQTAELREAQGAALALAHTGMAITTDIGDANDIHPRNKQEVGRRLSLLALRECYGQSGTEASGPVFAGITTEGSQVSLSFQHADGLTTTGGAIRGVWLAGDDKRFYPADARISQQKVIASHPQVARPVAARYGWSCVPDGNLVNGAGLPASPFRTDSWAANQTSQDQEADLERCRGKDDGLAALFNGANLTGWVNVNCHPTTWGVGKDERGRPIITCTGNPTGLLRTEKQYENFILELEWRHLDADGNAGVFVWSDPITAVGQPYSRAVEVQVMVGSEGDWFTSDGDIFPIHGAKMTPENGRGNGNRAFPTEKRMNPAPLWNHYRIECIDGKVSLAVNGKAVTVGREASPRKGYICLESEGTPIEFRNIRIKELPPASPPLPAAHAASLDEGFRPLFGGVDFAGWKHTKDHEGHWKIDDWTITFDGQGTDLWTDRPYKDFQLICDWRWTAKPTPTPRPVILPNGLNKKDADGTDEMQTVPDAGDSGIYLRGNTSSQVNIWCWPVGSGEVYGYRTNDKMPPEVRAGVTPREAADAPIGQWNRFIITMRGDRLTVVLNGKTVIENAQLPGVPESGPIGLQQHGNPVQFGNIYIKELK